MCCSSADTHLSPGPDRWQPWARAVSPWSGLSGNSPHCFFHLQASWHISAIKSDMLGTHSISLNFAHLCLLSDLWFAFLDCGHDHVTYPSSGKSVRPSQSFHFKLWPDSPFLTLLFLKEMSFREEGAKTPPASCLFVCFAWFCFLEPQFFIYQRSEMSVQVNNNHTLH